MSGKPIDEAVRALPLISWSDFWMQQGDRKTSHDYLAFEKALHWLNANLDALTAAQQQQGQVVAWRLWTNTVTGEWMPCTSEWNDGAPKPRIAESINSRLSQYRLEVAYAAPPPPSVPVSELLALAENMRDIALPRGLALVDTAHEAFRICADRIAALATQHQEPKS